MKKNIIKSLLICAASFILVAQAFGQANALKSPQDWVIEKNFYFNYLLYKNPVLLQELVQQPGLKELLNKKKAQYEGTLACQDVSCFVENFKWSDAEVALFTQGLLAGYDQNSAFKSLVDQDLVKSLSYGLNDAMTSRDYLKKAIAQDFNAIHHVIDVYAGGKKPNYPRIDSISFDVSQGNYLSVLADVRQDVLKDMVQDKDIVHLSLLSAVRFLEINERWDAALLEPLTALGNKKAIDAIKSTKWSDYAYTALLVLGAGPSQYDQAISPGGMLRCRMAARTYHQGLVPFIIVSGGRVHPYKTPYVEAVEMKKYLMEVHQIPEEAILMDPHARHTTTNLRNASRMLIKYGFPLDRFAITGSSVAHINFVEKMDARCLKELGYLPYTRGKRVNDVLLEFKPSMEALTIDWDEPLDP